MVFIESQDAASSLPHHVPIDVSTGTHTHDTPWMQDNTTANTEDTGDELINMEDQSSVGDPLDHTNDGGGSVEACPYGAEEL